MTMSGVMNDDDDFSRKLDNMLGETPTEDTSNETSQPSPTEGQGTLDSEASQSEARQSNANDREGRQSERGKEHRRDGQGAKPPQRRLPANPNGDLIDPQSGQVIARAGNERRFFEAARNAQGQLQRMQGELTRLTHELNGYREAAHMPKQLGLQPNEVVTAMQFMAHWKRNPVEAATKVLTELRAMGYEVEGLAPSIDMAALKQMVNEAVAPFKQDREAATREQEIAASVDRELSDLYTAHPWARHQQEELTLLLEADQTLTLREAALALKSYALEHGFDLSQPLRPQVFAAQNADAAPQPRANSARMPAPPATADAPIVPRRGNAAANHDRSNRDLIKEAMREAGLNVDNL